jgi:hypothetical protein
MSEILDAAIEYLDLGFSVLPIRPGETKKPYLTSWKEYQTRQPTEQEVYDWWAKWPDANVAIITGSVSGIFVIDGDGEIGARWITEHMPKTSVYAQTGRASGCHCFYRLPKGVLVPCKVGWRPKVDVRGEGGYVVAAPSIHHTGRQYRLIFREGLRGWEELHEFNPYAGSPEAGPGKRTGNLNLDLKSTKLPEQIFEPARQGERNQQLASITGKILKAGMTDEQAWDYVVAWNAKNKPPLSEKETAATFRSILKKHQQGDSLPAPVLLPSEPEQEDEPEDELASELAGTITDSMPVECLQPGGLLQEIMTYTEKSSAAHKPVFALGGAICLVGNLIGQRLITETGLRTNNYCVGIGYSGCGKNAAHSAISAILRASEARDSMGPTDTASAAAILKWIATGNHQVTLAMLDEIGMLLRGCQKQDSAMAGMPRLLTKVFSECDRPYAKSYADAKMNVTIPWLHLCLYASSTPGQFWGSVTSEDTTNGFLARLLIFEARDAAERPRPVIDPVVPKTLIEKVNALWNIKPPIDPERGDIARVPMPFVIPRSMGARQVFEQWSDRYWELRGKCRDDEAADAVYARAAEHAAKLALIHAASLKGPKIKQVDIESILWATRVTDACVGSLIRGIKSHVAQNAFHKEQQRIIDVIRKLGGKANSRSICRKIHASSKQVGELLTSLLSSGEIIQEVGKKNGQPIVFYRLAEMPLSKN